MDTATFLIISEYQQGNGGVMRRVCSCCRGRNHRLDHCLPAEHQVPGHCGRRQRGCVPRCLLPEWWGRQRWEYCSSELLHEPLVNPARLRMVPADRKPHQFHHQTKYPGGAQPFPVVVPLSGEFKQRADLAQLRGDATDWRSHCSACRGDVRRSGAGQNLAQFPLHSWPFAFQVPRLNSGYHSVTLHLQGGWSPKDGDEKKRTIWSGKFSVSSLVPMLWVSKLQWILSGDCWWFVNISVIYYRFSGRCYAIQISIRNSYTFSGISRNLLMDSEDFLGFREIIKDLEYDIISERNHTKISGFCYWTITPNSDEFFSSQKIQMSTFCDLIDEVFQALVKECWWCPSVRTYVRPRQKCQTMEIHYKSLHHNVRPIKSYIFWKHNPQTLRDDKDNDKYTNTQIRSAWKTHHVLIPEICHERRERRSCKNFDRV